MFRLVEKGNFLLSSSFDKLLLFWDATQNYALVRKIKAGQPMTVLEKTPYKGIFASAGSHTGEV